MTSEMQAGSRMGNYRIERVVSRGGMGVVYLARDELLDRRIALKILAPELAENETFRRRFVSESRIAASLDHPNIIPIYSAGEIGGVLYIAMRYVEGSDLKTILEREGPLDPYRAIVQIGTQVARALDAAHARGLVHRDVKPGNVLVTSGESPESQGHCYLADFGLTRNTAALSSLTAVGQFVGTLDYIAPEQIEDKELDGRADEYSLACVLFECITGRVPFRTGTGAALLYAHIQETPPPPSFIRPELPAALDEVFATAMAKRPQDRYRSCVGFVTAAREAVADDGSGTSVTLRGGGVWKDPASPATGRPPSPAPAPAEGTGSTKAAPAPTPGPSASRAIRWSAAVAVLVGIAVLLFSLRGGGGAGPSNLAVKRSSELEILDTTFAGAKLRLIETPGSAMGSAWAPSNASLAVVDETPDGTHIDILSARTFRVERILNAPGSVSHTTWLIDSTRILFVSTQNGVPEIYGMGPAGGGLRPLTADMAGGATNPAPSPAGGHIAFDGIAESHSQVFTMAVNGGGRRQLTTMSGGASNPSWSPNGKLIAFAGGGGGAVEVYRMTVNGNRLRQLTNARNGAGEPEWSPDGKHLVCVEGGGDQRRMVAISFKGGDRTVLTPPMAGLADPIWSAAGHTIYFISSPDGVPQLFAVDSRGGTPRQLTRLPGGAYHPDLQPDGTHIALATRTAAATGSPSSPSH